MSGTECLVCIECGFLYHNDLRHWPICPECYCIESRQATDIEEANMESESFGEVQEQ